MNNHIVKVYPSKQELKREDQLAWKIAAVASDPVGVDDDVTDMVINRMIDNASVAMASVRAQLDGICIGESTNRKECKTHAKRLQYPWDCNTPGNYCNSHGRELDNRCGRRSR